MKQCPDSKCKYCSKIINYIEQKRKEYYSLNELEREQVDEVNPETENSSSSISANQKNNSLSSKNIDLNSDSIDAIENKIITSIPSKEEIIQVRGDGNCAYNSILTSFGESEDCMTLRQLTAQRILADGLEEDYYLERNCSSFEEYTNKVKTNSFYAEEPELIEISKVKKIWISIYDELRKKWKIIKDKDNSKPSGLAFIIFQDTGSDLSCHYNAIREIKTQKRELLKSNDVNMSQSFRNKEKSKEPQSQLKIMIWNARSLCNYTKKAFIIDIMSNEYPDIAIISETFLLDTDNIYVKGYRTYKTKNNVRRKGCCIFLSKNILASVLVLKNDINGRYIKISLKSPNFDIPLTISSLYLEPDGNINDIPSDVLDADICAGDLNNAETGFKRSGVYHLNGIADIHSIKVNNKISDHDIIIGKAKGNVKLNERFTPIEINDKNIIEKNDAAIKGEYGKIFILNNQKKIIQKDNYKMSIKSMDKYDEFNKLKEIYDMEYKEKYKKIEKIIRGGDITKEGWYKINKLFDGIRECEIYTRDHMANDIIQFYQRL